MQPSKGLVGHTGLASNSFGSLGTSIPSAPVDGTTGREFYPVLPGPLSQHSEPWGANNNNNNNNLTVSSAELLTADLESLSLVETSGPLAYVPLHSGGLQSHSGSLYKLGPNSNVLESTDFCDSTLSSAEHIYQRDAGLYSIATNDAVHSADVTAHNSRPSSTSALSADYLEGARASGNRDDVGTSSEPIPWRPNLNGSHIRDSPRGVAPGRGERRNQGYRKLWQQVHTSSMTQLSEYLNPQLTGCDHGCSYLLTTGYKGWQGPKAQRNWRLGIQ